MGSALQASLRNDLFPGHPLSRGIRLRLAGVDRAGFREVPGEEARIDVKAENPSGRAELENAPVMIIPRPHAALSPAFPSVHPFLEFRVPIRDENGRRGLHEVLLG